MMVTAYGDDARRRRATELGAFEFITKPVDFRQVVGAATPVAIHGLLKAAASSNCLLKK
jgi:DNA-binding response OmpR family regulator